MFRAVGRVSTLAPAEHFRAGCHLRCRLHTGYLPSPCDKRMAAGAAALGAVAQACERTLTPASSGPPRPRGIRGPPGCPRQTDLPSCRAAGPPSIVLTASASTTTLKDRERRK